MRTIVALSLFLVACGGTAANPPVVTPAAPTTVTVAPPPTAITPAPFTGSFDIIRMSDAKSSVVVADVFKRGNSVDGRMAWDFGPASFSVSIWQIGEPTKLSDTDVDWLYSFCRGSATVDAHWEGMTIVLGSTVKVDGAGSALRLLKKPLDGNKTLRRTVDDTTSCSASLATTKITFEVLEKGDGGATRLRAKAEDGTFELARSKPTHDVVAKEVLDASPLNPIQ